MLNPAPRLDPTNSVHLLEPATSRGQSQRLIIQGALRRGIGVEMFNDTIYRLSAGGSHADMHLGMSTRVPHVARQQTNSKSISKVLMARGGMSVPEGQQFMPTQAEAAWQFAKDLLPVVVKPAVGAFAKNVTVRVQDRDGFHAAFAVAAQGKRFQVVVERYIEGFDHRVLIIGDQVRSCTLRRYASVLGNGVDPVSRLLDETNLGRQKNPLAAQALIPAKPGVHYDQFPQIVDYEAVPQDGQRVYLRDDHFVFEGRDIVDWTDQLHPEFCRIALKAREIFGPLPSFGLDLLAPDVSAHPDSQDWAFCEINLNSSHALQHLPIEGMPRDTVGCLLADLFPTATLEQEANAAADGVSITVLRSGAAPISGVEVAIGLHSLTIEEHREDETHQHYVLNGRDYLVQGFLRWIGTYCVHEDFWYRS